MFFPEEEEPIPSAAGSATVGYSSSEDGKLHMNLDPNSDIKNCKETIDTVLYENIHHYKDELVKMLRNGSLKSSGPRRN